MIDQLARLPRPSRTALYLRCYPSDAAGLDYQRTALEGFAAQLGLPGPGAYVDDGVRSGGRLPALERLLQRAEHGWVDTVLVPGPFVFALDDRAARATVHRLEQFGCAVIELPDRTTRHRPPAPRSGDAPPARTAAAAPLLARSA